MSDVPLPMPRLRVRSAKMVDVLRGAPVDPGRRLARVYAMDSVDGVATVILNVGDPPDQILIPNVRFQEGLQLTAGDSVWYHQDGPTAFVYAKLPPPAAEATGTEVVVRGTYTDWIWDDSIAPASPGWGLVDFPMSPQIDASPGAIFYAQQFPMFNNGDGGYIGLQTSDPWRTNKIAISSMFGTVLDAIAGPGGYANFGPTAADGSPGSSTAIPYNWMAGKEYLMRITFDGTPAGKTNAAGPWYSSYVMERDWANPGFYAATLISRQQIPAATGQFGDASSNAWTNFTEYYGLKPHRCKDIPYSRCWFGPPVAYDDFTGAGPAPVTSHLNHASTGEGCSNFRISDVNEPGLGGVIHEIGIR